MSEQEKKPYMSIRDYCKRADSFAYFGDEDRDEWGFSFLSVHRDSDTVTRSNWEVITKDLHERFPESIKEISTSHWMVGWMNHLLVKMTHQELLDAIEDWSLKLDDYAIADEDHFSKMEWDETCEAIETWISKDLVHAISLKMDDMDEDSIQKWVEDHKDTIDEYIHDNVILESNGPAFDAYSAEMMDKLRELGLAIPKEE